MKEAIISIITPSYNCSTFFINTFNSVVGQTFIYWEWIIVDDCSSDGSFEYISNLIKTDSRIRIFKTQNNSGTSVARNIGLKKATGRYITFLDSDDTIDPNYLEEQFGFISLNGPIITASYRRMAQHSCTDFIVPKYIDYKLALKGNPLSCLTTMYDREIIGDVFFPENIDKPEDYVFWLNILKTGYIVKGNQKILATYYIREGSKSSNKIGLIRRMYRVYHKTQGFSFVTSWLFVLRWAIYGKRKYKNVK